MEMKINKTQIKSIKYFIKQEERYHSHGEWDKFKIKRIKVKSDGSYSFELHWWAIVDRNYDDYEIDISGNLFDEFPTEAVYDGLDAVKLMFHPIHLKACERAKKYMDKDIESFNDDKEYIDNIYSSRSWKKS